MANTDWWGQSAAPMTAEQQQHAKNALAIERNWAAEAEAIRLERERRKKSALSQLMIGGVALVVGLGAWLFADTLGPYQGVILAVAFIFGYSGFRQLIRAI